MTLALIVSCFPHYSQLRQTVGEFFYSGTLCNFAVAIDYTGASYSLLQLQE